jgi:hypothetical protein
MASRSALVRATPASTAATRGGRSLSISMSIAPSRKIWLPVRLPERSPKSLINSPVLTVICSLEETR